MTLFEMEKRGEVDSGFVSWYKPYPEDLADVDVENVIGLVICCVKQC